MSAVKVYVASSWRNERQPEVVQRLRAAGYEVYDFRNPSGAPGDCGFAWSEIERRWKNWTPEEYVRALDHPSAKSGFAADMHALVNCDACVLVEPCGISAHLEFGHAIGAGKLGIVLVPGIREPELMLRMAHSFAFTLDEVVAQLAAARTATPAPAVRAADGGAK